MQILIPIDIFMKKKDFKDKKKFLTENLKTVLKDTNTISGTFSAVAPSSQNLSGARGKSLHKLARAFSMIFLMTGKMFGKSQTIRKFDEKLRKSRILRK